MQPEEVRTIADARAIVEERKLQHVKVGVFDNDGILRGKYIDRDKFLSALDKGMGFCDVVLGWDSNDQQYDNITFTGWHTAFPDAPVRLLPETCRALPLEGNMLLFLGEFAGGAERVCPRATLRRVLQRAAGMGFAASASAEFEFFVFEETPTTVREKGYRGLKNLTPGYFGYSILRSSVHAELYQDLLRLADDMRMPVEGLHTETGPGVIEAALHYTDALEAADRAALFKTFTKAFAQRRGLMVTFMAKWSQQLPGQSGHLHVSLAREDGSSAFHDEAKPDQMSDEMRWFVGGQQALMPELLAMVASTVNSYSRLVPGFWAPTAATWGIENRTCALRVIKGGAKSQRVEYRIAAADINPYLAIAVAVGSGLWGIEHRIEPDEPITGNAYDRKLPAKRQLPRTLSEAAGRLARSKAAQDLFGAPFVDHFAASREWEEREFRRAVTDWELARYFEII
ncbi:MAG: glutamine synthetase [Gammaproteobacteria bacterium]|nr:glutamine synthetase [Gammaproteobacteria bacterium]